MQWISYFPIAGILLGVFVPLTLAQELQESVFSTTFCTHEDWQCTSWSECDDTGVERRSCTPKTSGNFIGSRPSQQRFCTPACRSDIWDCTTFSDCFAGQQTRTCTLVSDCPTTETPKPVERQDCTISCTADTWDCSPWGACDAVRRTQSRICRIRDDCPTAETPSPPITQFCSPSCNEYTCSPWGECESDGYQRRSCELQSDCFDASEPIPLTERICLGLRCRYLLTMRERVQCSLGLSPGQRMEQRRIVPLPEHCTTYDSTTLRKWCQSVDSILLSCVQLQGDKERLECVRTSLQIGSFPVEGQRCQLLPQPEQVTCFSKLERNVRLFVLFTLLDLEHQVRRFHDQGFSSSDTLDFLVFLEEQKAVLHTIENRSVLRFFLQRTEERWQQFLSTL